MTKLAYSFYIYVKSNGDATAMKLNKAFEEIEVIRKSLPLHLSRSPASDENAEWEENHPWIPFQRYLISHVIDFMRLSISRILSMQNAQEDSQKHRAIAAESAKNILHSYLRPHPRVYKLVWVVSASAVASSIYLTLHHLIPHGLASEVEVAEQMQLIKNAAAMLRQHSDVAIHAAKGSEAIERLLELCGRWEPPQDIDGHSMRDVLIHLSAKISPTTPTALDSQNFRVDLDALGMESILDSWCVSMEDFFSGGTELDQTLFENHSQWTQMNDESWPTLQIEIE